MPFAVRASPAPPHRCAPRDSVLRRVSFGSAHRSKRVGWNCLPRGPWPRDRRPGRAGGRPGDRLQAGRIAAVGCMVDSCRTCPDCRDGEEQYCQNELVLHLQQPRQAHRRRHLRRVFQSDRGGRAVRAPVPRRTRPCGRARRCSAPASPRTRRCATGRSDRDRKSGSSASADSAIWG